MRIDFEESDIKIYENKFLTLIESSNTRQIKEFID